MFKGNRDEAGLLLVDTDEFIGRLERERLVECSAEETEAREERRMEAVECGVPGIRGNRNFTGRTHDH